MARVCQQRAPGAQAAETLQRRWEILEQNTDGEAERIRTRYRSQDQQVASDRDLTEFARRRSATS